MRDELQSKHEELLVVTANADRLGKALIAMKQDQNDLRQRGLDSRLEADRLDELAELRRQVLDSKEQTQKIKNQSAHATRKNLESAKSLGNCMRHKITDIANDAFKHTNNVLLRQGAPQDSQCVMLPHFDIDTEQDIQE